MTSYRDKKTTSEKEKDRMERYTTTRVRPIMGVSEGGHKYGADAFEEFMAKQRGKYMEESPVDIPSVKKDEKERYDYLCQ